ncbi:MAG: hypothetical protein QOI82_1016, partial [Actinomycetota bacterium]|nr:hypothetical protein [Actinomycetota bacterium]
MKSTTLARLGLMAGLTGLLVSGLPAG